MYTAIKLGDTFDKEKQRRIITVKFSDTKTEFVKDFEFNPTATVEDMKRRVKTYLDELNYVAPVIANGVMDLTIVEPVPTQPTAAEIAEKEWRDDWAKLQIVQQLIAAGVLTGTETAITTLRNKVKTGFKASYL